MGDPNGNPVAINMTTLSAATPLVTTECCIYRVPREIRKLNPAAYTPKVVSIGPFHRGNEILQSMESQKQLYCHEFIKRAQSKTFVDLKTYVRELEPRVRKCYSEKIELNQEKFVELILVDCGFILEFLLRISSGHSTENDALRRKEWLMSHIKLDLLLLENQLPFFVLNDLYDRALDTTDSREGGQVEKPSFRKLVFDYFVKYNKLQLVSTNNDITIQHFTDLLRTFHIQGQPKERVDQNVTQLKCASALYDAGVTFEVNIESRCLLDLQTAKRRHCCYLLKGLRCLKIPELKVEDCTELLFRNMLALEQCHYPKKSHVTDYVAMLSFLMKTGKDVDLLIEKKIIVNWLVDSDAVAEQFDGLWKNITQLGFNPAYVAISQELNAFCGHWWYSRKATLRRDYCNTPWKKVACFAAILVIILTIIQTVCSILQVVQH